MERVKALLALLWAYILRKTPDHIEEEVEDILADFQEKIARLDVVVDRHRQAIADAFKRQLELDEVVVRSSQAQVKAEAVRDRLKDFIG